jgi:hypothetical protein
LHQIELVGQAAHALGVPEDHDAARRKRRRQLREHRPRRFRLEVDQHVPQEHHVPRPRRPWLGAQQVADAELDAPPDARVDLPVPTCRLEPSIAIGDRDGAQRPGRVPTSLRARDRIRVHVVADELRRDVGAAVGQHDCRGVQLLAAGRARGQEPQRPRLRSQPPLRQDVVDQQPEVIGTTKEEALADGDDTRQRLRRR